MTIFIRHLNSLFIFFFLCSAAFAGQVFNPHTGKLDIIPTIAEEDGSPSLNGCKTIKFSNGNVTDNGDGTCSIADQTGAGGGDEITVNTTAATNANFLDNIYVDWTLVTASTPDDITAKYNYAETLAGDPALLVDECIFAKDTSGGFFLCEGSTADTAEQAYRFPDLNGSDTTEYILVTTTADKVGDAQIADGAVDGGAGGEIADGSVTADDLGTDSVSADELNATGVETELEAVLDLDQLQGQIGDAQIADGAVDGGTGGEIADASITTADISGSAGITAAQTALTAGRSLTLSTNDILADAELYTHTFCYRLPASPVAGDDDKSVWINDTANAFTVTKLWCESDQTVTMMLQVDDGTPADMDSVDLVCISTPDTDTSLDGDAGIAAGDRVDLDVASVSGTPTWGVVCFTGTWDD